MKRAFFNLKMDVITSGEVLSYLKNSLNADKVRTMYFINAHCFNIAQENNEYRRIVNESDLLLNDGIGIQLASRCAGIRFPENLNGTDLIPKVLKLSSENHAGVYFLGSKPEIVEKAAAAAAVNHPGLTISGYHTGFFNTREEQEILQKINASRAKILILGMGVPRQELWADKNKGQLNHVKMIIAGGAILDFISGEIRRAPRWMRKIYMEWLFRFFLEPKRMWRRYFIGNFRFFYSVLRLKS